MFVDYGRAMSAANRADEAIGGAAQIKFDGGFKEAHFELGLLLERNGRWSDTIGLNSARPLKAQQTSRYFYAMATCELRMGDAIAVRNYIEQGVCTPESPRKPPCSKRLWQTIVRRWWTAC
jgi:hypothetical protein